MLYICMSVYSAMRILLNTPCFIPVFGAEIQITCCKGNGNCAGNARLCKSLLFNLYI